MDNGAYKFKTLESKYGNFLAPAFAVTVGATRVDSAKTPISSLSVDIDAGDGAGGCVFTLESQYDYEKGKWAQGLLDTIQVGKKILIQAGYVTKKQIFYGFVDDLTVDYSSENAPRLTVTGIDAKGYLMNAARVKYMSEKAPQAAIREILSECVSRQYATSVTIGDASAYTAQLIQEGMDAYGFLCFLAEILNMRFFVVNGEIIFENVLARKKSILTLTLGISLLRFSKTMSLRRQLGKIIVYGIDPKTKHPIRGEAVSNTIGGGGDEAGDIAGPFDHLVEKIENRFVATPEECQQLAQAKFNARAMGFVQGKGRCIGIPELIPGRYITLDGMDSRANGDYFIQKVTHEYSSEQGYFTNFEVRRATTK
jgi:phage protein D